MLNHSTYHYSYIHISTLTIGVYPVL